MKEIKTLEDFKEWVGKCQEGGYVIPILDVVIPKAHIDEFKEKADALAKEEISYEEFDKFLERIGAFPTPQEYNDGDPWKANAEYTDEVNMRDD